MNDNKFVEVASLKDRYGDTVCILVPDNNGYYKLPTGFEIQFNIDDEYHVVQEEIEMNVFEQMHHQNQTYGSDEEYFRYWM